MFGMGAAISDEERLERDEARAVLGRAARMAAPFRRTVLAALAFIAVSTSATVIGPLLVRYGIDHGIRDGDARALDVSVVLYVVVAIVAYLGGRQQHVFVNRAGEGFLRILRIRVFDHIQRQSLAFFDRNKSGVLVSRMTADIESLAELVQWGVLQFVAAAILLTFSLVVLFVLSWQLTLVALMVLPIIIVASIKFQRDSNAAYLEVRERVGQNLSALQEGISGVRVIQAYAREPEQRRRFRTSNRALYDSHLHSVRVSTWYFGSGRVLRRARHRPGDRRRWLARAPRRPVGRHGRGRRVAARQPVRAGAAALAALQHGAVGHRVAAQAVHDPRHRTRRRRTRRRGPVAAARRPRRRRCHVLLSRTRRPPRSSTCRFTSVPVNDWRSWARPAPASRRWPS